MGCHSFIRLSLLSFCLLNPPSQAMADPCLPRYEDDNKCRLPESCKQNVTCSFNELLEGREAAMRENITCTACPNNIKIGLWGDHGGSNVIGLDLCASRITRVVLHTGDVIDGLEIDHVVDRNEVITFRLGGTGGGVHEFTLCPNEYINSMVGSFGNFYGETCITMLEFTTNLRNKHGPFGQGGGKEFTVPVMNGRIMGFFGQFNKYINAIGVYLAP